MHKAALASNLLPPTDIPLCLQYRINLRAKRVFDTSAAMKYCSDECARRSIWYETVCLQQNAFEVLDPSQPIQLLEDTENIMQTDSISLPAQLPPAQLEQFQQSSNSTMSSPSAPADLPMQVEEIAYNQQAESFLARLAIVERQPTYTPLPPSEDYADEINQEDNPTIAQVGIASSNLASSGPFNLDSLHRDLPSETQDSQTGSTVIVEERAGLARRIEFDVDPEYRNLLDEGFELYKQMKEAGEFT